MGESYSPGIAAIRPSETAALAGVEPAYLDRLAAEGIVSSKSGAFSAPDVRRVAIAHMLDEAGLPLEALAAAIRAGRVSLAFVDAPTFERYATASAETFADIQARTGISAELLATVSHAVGRPHPGPEGHVRHDELAVIPLVEFMLERAFRPEAIERWIQVYGESLRRIAETEEDYFQSEVMAPHLERGLSYGEALSASIEWSPRLGELGDQALQAIYRSQQARSWVRGIIKFIEQELVEAGLHTRLDRPPAIAFLDITGYTRLTEERGDVAAAELAERLARLVQRASTARGGQAVKWLGDGVMFHFPDPRSAVLASLEMVEGLAAAQFPPAHVGLHAGPVLFQEGDYFGRTVNIAARIAGFARAGEVLVSQDVVEAWDGSGVEFTELGPVELKGLTGTIQLYSARRMADDRPSGSPNGRA